MHARAAHLQAMLCLRTSWVAPHAQGRQEEDSHDLLRKLLDGLELEEKRARGDVGQARQILSVNGMADRSCVRALETRGARTRRMHETMLNSDKHILHEHVQLVCSRLAPMPYAGIGTFCQGLHVARRSRIYVGARLLRQLVVGGANHVPALSMLCEGAD